jgi:hypothetical protein
VPISSPRVDSVAVVAPVATAVTGEEGCVAAAGPVVREERDEGLRSCRFGLARDVIHDIGVAFLNLGQMRGFGGKSGRMQHRPGLTE